MLPGTQGYAEFASVLLGKRLDFDAVHAPYLHLLPSAPARVLDVGAGPGHDAAQLAQMGHEVVACEPTPALRVGAQALYASGRITWLDDGLPELRRVTALGLRYDFILMSGVWMHLNAAERQAALPRVAELLEPGGVWALSLRHGPVPPGRRMFQVSAEETVRLAAVSGLTVCVSVERGSLQPRNQQEGVTWTVLAVQRSRS